MTRKKASPANEIRKLKEEIAHLKKDAEIREKQISRIVEVAAEDKANFEGAERLLDAYSTYVQEIEREIASLLKFVRDEATEAYKHALQEKAAINGAEERGRAAGYSHVYQESWYIREALREGRERLGEALDEETRRLDARKLRAGSKQPEGANQNRGNGEPGQATAAGEGTIGFFGGSAPRRPQTLGELVALFTNLGIVPSGIRIEPAANEAPVRSSQE